MIAESEEGAKIIAAWRASAREVAVIGLGRSGVAASLLLRHCGIPVYASDTSAGQPYEAWAATLRDAGVAVELGGHDAARIAGAAAAVVAPGVPPDAPVLHATRVAGVEIYAEVDLGFLALGGSRCVAVTGTNGKTTTTSLVAHLLTAGGVSAVAAGNIGWPLSEVARSASPPAWIALELSSFQLHDAPHLKPAVGMLTNLSPNHLDRYATLGEYYADKARLFRNADATSVWITNADDEAVQGMVNGVAGRHRRFSIRKRADGWYDRAAGWLMLGDAPLLPRAELPLLGEHNVANALAAALAATEVGVPPARIADGLRTFHAVPHRVEPVREVDGVLWINDSKSTNIASTAVAVAALDRPFVLLLGGRHKGAAYTGLAEALRERCRAIVAYGEAAALIDADLGGQFPVVRAATFAEVLDRARALARPGEAVLLSPACSSFDMFRNYEARGDCFRAAVEAL